MLCFSLLWLCNVEYRIDAERAEELYEKNLDEHHREDSWSCTPKISNITLINVWMDMKAMIVLLF
jgi:hypothetical protein